MIQEMQFRNLEAHLGEPASALLSEILTANERYASSFAGAALAAPPRRRLAVVTCMDARIDPAKALGLEDGDAHVIRNAGGVVSDDALRSLVISHWLLGTQEALVIGHSDCGMVSFTNEQLRAEVAAGTGADVCAIDFLAFRDVRARVAESIAQARASALLPASFRLYGLVYDVRTGRLERVA